MASHIKIHQFHIEDNGRALKTVRVHIKFSPNELFLHFDKGSNFPTTYWQGPDEFKGYFPDHISFHRNGKIHVKARDSDKKASYLPGEILSRNPFKLQIGEFIPLVSIGYMRVKEVGFNLAEAKSRELKNSRCLGNLDDIAAFTLVLFSKCKSIPLERWTRKLGLLELEMLGPPVHMDSFLSPKKELASELVMFRFKGVEEGATERLGEPTRSEMLPMSHFRLVPSPRKILGIAE